MDLIAMPERNDVLSPTFQDYITKYHGVRTIRFIPSFQGYPRRFALADAVIEEFLIMTDTPKIPLSFVDVIRDAKQYYQHESRGYRYEHAHNGVSLFSREDKIIGIYVSQPGIREIFFSSIDYLKFKAA